MSWTRKCCFPRCKLDAEIHTGFVFDVDTEEKITAGWCKEHFGVITSRGWTGYVGEHHEPLGKKDEYL